MRTSLGLFLVLLGCATGRSYKTDRFEVKIGEGTRVEEQPGRGRTDWRFLDASGEQFLGASVYSIVGDPTVACGIPLVERNRVPALLIRRTLGSRPVVSVLFPQDDGTVLDFSYDEREERARSLLASVQVRRSLRRGEFACETLRGAGRMSGDIYDSGFFTVKLLPGTWLLDAGHVRQDPDRPAMAPGQPMPSWTFEEATTGARFLSAHLVYSDLVDDCPEGRLIDINGSAAFRSSDTDNLEPYPGPSNVRVTFLLKRGFFPLVFAYDEHSATAQLAEKTLESLRVRDVAPVPSDCRPMRKR